MPPERRAGLVGALDQYIPARGPRSVFAPGRRSTDGRKPRAEVARRREIAEHNRPGSIEVRHAETLPLTTARLRQRSGMSHEEARSQYRGP
jgi:hypothetical protein